MSSLRSLIFAVVLSLVSFVCRPSGAVRMGPPIHLKHKLVTPSEITPGRTYPLIVLLHGCLQSATQFAELTHSQELADKANVFVLLPEQSPRRHPARCWKWYDRHNFTRGGVEPLAIMDLIEKTKDHYPIDSRKVFVGGLSAGSTMAHTLVSCYPEVFRGALLHSGPPYFSAHGLADSARVMKRGTDESVEELAEHAYTCGGPGQLYRPVMLVTGSADQAVNPVHSQTLWDLQLTLARMRIPYLFRVPPVAVISEGNSSGGRHYKTRQLKVGRQPIVSEVNVQTMNHAWGGGKKGYPFSDPKGPDITSMMWEFFSQI